MINHLVIIDDDPIARRVNSLLVQRAGLTSKATCLADGFEGIDYLEKIDQEEPEMFPELIFLDIQMPRLDGFGFLEVYSTRFAERYPLTKIVMVSASPDLNDFMKALVHPFVLTFLQKPVRLKELEELKENKHLCQGLQKQNNKRDEVPLSSH